jgi:hypothetical protein
LENKKVLAHKSPGNWINYPESTKERETIENRLTKNLAKREETQSRNFQDLKKRNKFIIIQFPQRRIQ